MSPMNEHDPYWKLRPIGPTPADELCRCTDEPPIVLQGHPKLLACLRCNREVPPERIGFTAELAEALAFWRNVQQALWYLWLDSDEYEVWARARLEDPSGQVNVRGLELAHQLNKYRRAYYWWFEDNTVDGFVPLSRCPCCALNLVDTLGKRVCEACSIVVPDAGGG